MEKRYSEDIVNLHSDSFKRRKNCGAVKKEFYYEGEQPPEPLNPRDAVFAWGMDLPQNFTNQMGSQMTTPYMETDYRDFNASNMPEMGTEYIGMDHIGPNHFGMSNIDLNYIGMDQMSMNQLGVDQMGMEHMGMDQMGMDHMGMNHMGMDQMGMDHMGMDQMGMDHMGMDHMGMDHMGMDHMGMDHMGMDHMGMDHMGMDHMAPEIGYQHVDQMFQIVSHMLEEIINREARIIRLIEELKANQPQSR